MKLSIVTTLFCSEKYIAEFYRRITKVIDDLEGVLDDYEIVFVDDGSPDSSLAKVVALANEDHHVKVIELSRNHGHHRAMTIGLEHAKGEQVFLIDVDLEEPPESLTKFWMEMTANDELDLVYGIQRSKEGSGFKKALSMGFYKLFNFFSNVQIPDNELVSRLMKRNYVDALLLYKERELFVPGVWADVGFKRLEIMAEKTHNGESSYTLARRVSMAVDAVTSFSTKPLLFVFYLGFTMSAISVFVAIYLIIMKLFGGSALGGWTSILVSLYLIGGVIIFCIGTVGLYLSRVFAEVKQRPLSLVRKIHQRGKNK